MDKYIEKLIYEATTRYDTTDYYEGGSKLFKYHIEHLNISIVKSLLTQAMQAQAEACCREFLTEYNSGNYDDPFAFMTMCKDKILNAKVENERD